MRPLTLALLMALSSVRFLCAAPVEDGGDAAMSVGLDPAWKYAAEFRVVVRESAVKGKPRVTFMDAAFVLASKTDIAKPRLLRVKTQDVRCSMLVDGETAKSDRVDPLLRFLEQLEYTVPIRLDETVDSKEFADSIRNANEYTRFLAAALVPPYPAPPTDKRGRAVSIPSEDACEENTELGPHIGYFDGWLDEELFTTAVRPKGSSIAKFVYNGATEGANYDHIVLLDVDSHALVESRLRFWSKVSDGKSTLEAWKTYHICRKLPKTDRDGSQSKDDNHDVKSKSGR